LERWWGIMKRKVIQIANSTQLVSLPRKWALEQGIKKGDEINVSIIGNALLINTDRDSSTKKEIDLDVTDVDRTTLINVIRALYRKGYNTRPHTTAQIPRSKCSPQSTKKYHVLQEWRSSSKPKTFANSDASLRCLMMSSIICCDVSFYFFQMPGKIS